MSKELTSAEVVILAGGKGERMGALTQNRQKCLIPFEGKPVLGYVIDSISEAFGSAKVILCVSFRAEDVYRYVEQNKPSNITTEYVLDEGNSRIANIIRALEGRVSIPFVAFSGDIIVESSSVYSSGYEQVLQEGVLTSVSLSPRVNEVKTHAVGKIEQNRVVEFLYPPPKSLHRDHLRDMTVWGIGRNFYAYARHYPEIPAVSRLIQQAVQDQEYVAGKLYEGAWIHFGSPADLRKTLQ